MFRLQRVLFAALAILFGLASTANATVVNADFSRDVTGGNNPGGNPAPVLYVGTGPAPDTGTIWNDLQIDMTGGSDTVAAGTTFTDLTDSAGNGTGIDIRLTSGFYRAFNDGTGTSNALQEERVFARNGNTAVLTVQDLTPGSAYDIYLIASGDFSTDYTLGTSFPGSGAMTALGGDFDSTWTLGDEYTAFLGVVADGSGEINIALRDTAGTGFGAISGIQIVSHAPEPASFLLLLSGMIGALVTRRRRRV